MRLGGAEMEGTSDAWVRLGKIVSKLFPVDSAKLI
jgi:hypothetical protein